MAIFIALLILFFLPGRAMANPDIFNWSPVAKPGDIVNLQGADFGEHPIVFCSINGAGTKAATLINVGHNVIHFKMPGPPGICAVSVHDSMGKKQNSSAVICINKAKPTHLDTQTVSNNQTFRIFGSNLTSLNQGFVPRVVLVSASGKQIEASCQPAKLRENSFNTLTVRVPADLPLGKYQVYASNGLDSWRSARALCPDPLSIVDRGVDLYTLKVHWAQSLNFADNIYDVRNDKRLSLHAVGDGMTNDQPALQAAINKAAADGGGTVYLPAGHYKLQSESGPLLDLKSRVVIQGAGEDAVITYGYGKPGAHFYLAMFSDVQSSGLCQLRFVNLNQNNAWSETGSIATSGKTRQIFLSQLSGELQNAARIELKGDRIAVLNCRLNAVNTLLFMVTCTNSLVRGNKLKQTRGVNLDLTESDHCVVENNRFILDADKGAVHQGCVRHGMAIAFAHRLVVRDNIWETTNGSAICNNDGESILSEGGGGWRPGEEIGQVYKSVQADVIAVQKELKFVPGSVIAMINGKGMGQWRSIKSRQAKEITISGAWAVPPDQTSTYAIFIWSNQDTIISDNTFRGWPRGIWFYQGSTTDTQISNNTLERMDGIFIEPCQNASRSNGQFNPVWNTLFDHNNLSSGAYGTYINITADLQKTTTLLGTMALNNEIYDNHISGTGSEKFQNDPAQTEGFCNYLRVEAAPYEDQNVPALLGTIFQLNSAIRCGAHNYLLNGGAYQTTIVGQEEPAQFCKDATFYWNTPGKHGSVGTIFR